MILGDRWGRLFAINMGSGVCGGRAIRAVVFGCSATTRTTDAGVVITLAGRCHPPVFIGKCSFKLKQKV